LSRSRFSLCPRGTGPSTIRFWESLGAGSIPVLIGSDMGLPDGYDWKKCVITISELDINKIHKILSSFTLEQESRMRESCLEAYSKFSGKNFIYPIVHFFDKRIDNE